jgi:hypothetical protein
MNANFTYNAGTKAIEGFTGQSNRSTNNTVNSFRNKGSSYEKLYLY